MLLDVHTHRPAPYPEGVISEMCESMPEILSGQLYSVGVHPWSQQDFEATFARVEQLAARPQVAAIGECGIDIPKGGVLFRQMQHFKRHVDLSEKLRKPLIIHCVKAHDILIGLRRDMKPQMPWAIHGFRGKPTVLAMLLDAGFHISLGEKFNPQVPALVPADRLLAETDESALSIQEIIAAISRAAGRDVCNDILRNTAAFLQLDNN